MVPVVFIELFYPMGSADTQYIILLSASENYLLVMFYMFYKTVGIQAVLMTVIFIEEFK